MKEDNHVSSQHPRAESIRIRERLTKHVETKVLALAGLIAHGRGEAFDYILGEETTPSAREAITAAAATLLLAERPVLSVNGNVAALCAEEFVELSKATGAKLEVNLFHRLPGREEAIEAVLREAGAEEVLASLSTASMASSLPVSLWKRFTSSLAPVALESSTNSSAHRAATFPFTESTGRSARRSVAAAAVMASLAVGVVSSPRM